MGQRARRSGMLSMMDGPEMSGLAAYMQGRRWLRDGEGHGDGGGEDADDDTGDDESEDEEEEEGDDDSDKSKKDKKEDDDTDEDDKPKYSAREYEKLKRRLAASDKRQGTLAKQLEELKNGKAGELDKAVRAEIDEIKPKLSKLETENRTLRLQAAMLTTTVKGVEWQDPEAVMRLVDLSDVDIDPETGAIDKRDLAAALRRLAKDKPYLVKKAKAADTDDDEPEDKSSGAPMNKRVKKTRGAPDRAALAKRFPVLNRLQP